MAENITTQAQRWLAQHEQTRYGDRGLRLQMEEAARLLREFIAAATPPTIEDEIARLKTVTDALRRSGLR